MRTTIITSDYVEAIVILNTRFDCHNLGSFHSVLVANDDHECELFRLFGKTYSSDHPARNILVFNNELRLSFFMNQLYADTRRENASISRIVAARRILTNVFARYGIVYTVAE